MMTGVVLFLAYLAVVSLAVYAVRRAEGLAALVAAAGSLGGAVALWKLPLAGYTRLAGRPVALGAAFSLQDLTLAITPAARTLLVFLLAVAAVTFILAWRTHQGRSFYPFGLALVALWATVALIHPLTWAPLAFVLASIVAVFLIQAGRPGDTRGAWRQMLFPSLAAPLFLVAAWYIEQAPLNPDNTTPYRIAGWLLIAGFVLLLQPAPLHVAMPAVARQSPPVVAAFLWIGGQSTTLFLLQRFLVTYPWLATMVDSARWLLWFGVLTAVTGGVLAALQDRLGTFAGYAVVYDYGVLLVAMALSGSVGLSITIWLLLTRTVALLTLAAGAAMLRHHLESDRFAAIKGAASRLPWATSALIMGGFAVAGLPLSAQFASRWALLQLVAGSDTRWVVLLVLGGVGVLAGALRAGMACFGKLTGSPVEREPMMLGLLAGLLVVTGLVLALFPQVLAAPVAAVIGPLSALEP
ncbi:MAG TPA: proton-conducting transporter membrane subunit [Anaerolineae bacterium]